jgi:hypothetical protein
MKKIKVKNIVKFVVEQTKESDTFAKSVCFLARSYFTALTGGTVFQADSVLVFSQLLRSINI